MQSIRQDMLRASAEASIVPGRPPLKVLVVEDDAMIGMYLGEVLAGMGHIVCAIETTQAGAVAAAALHAPDLMIVDGRLQAGSGVDAMHEILRGGFVAHVFVSGDGLHGEHLSPHAVVIQKPFYEADLVRAIARALGEAAALRATLA